MKQLYLLRWPQLSRLRLLLSLLLLGWAALVPRVTWAVLPLILEAENAQRQGLQVLRELPGYAGTGYLGNFADSTAAVTFTFQAPAGHYQLRLRYAAPDGAKEYQLTVNGEQSGYQLPGTSPSFADYLVGRIQLREGQNTIILARGHFALDYIALTPVQTRAQVVPLVNGRAEAELGELTGVQVAASPVGFSGTGFVTGFDAATDNVRIQFDNPTAGLYKLTIGYTSPSGDKGYDLQVNQEQSSGMFAGSAARFQSAEAGTYRLPSGLNTVIIRNGWGYYGIDYLQLTPATASLPAAVPSGLADAQATPATRALLTYLRSLYGSKVLAGQHAGPENKLADIQYILAKTGKEPALGSFDLIEYSPSRIQYGSNPAGHSEQYLAWAQQGNGRGIVSLMWHWNAPTDLINTTANPWWRGFYTDGTTFDIEAALADPAGSRYQLLLRDIDAIAVQLKKFQAANIPVLWRPLHEAPGAFFWWGAKGPEPYKALWRLLYERLTSYHQLHNLIWVYSTTQSPSLAWYPGDSYVDISGVDLYVHASANMSGDWAGLQHQYGGKKLVALTESGNLPDPDKIRGYGTWWSWFTIWQGQDFIQRQPDDLLRRVYADQDVITRDELPNWAGTVTATYSPTKVLTPALSVHPNPASGYSLSVQLALPAPQLATITLTNTLGQALVQLPARLQAGENTFQVPIAQLPAGMYLLTVQAAQLHPLTQRVFIRP